MPGFRVGDWVNILNEAGDLQNARPVVVDGILGEVDDETFYSVNGSTTGIAESKLEFARGKMEDGFYQPVWDAPGVDIQAGVRLAGAGVDLNVGQRTTDMGNAERLVVRHGHDLRYCHPWHRWFVWDEKRWAEDDTAAVRRCAKETARSIYEEAGRAADKADRARLAKWAMRTEANSSIKAMLESAQSELPVLPDDLDNAQWMLNFTNGTLDLRTGELREQDRNDLITRLVPVAYDSSAKAPLWETFLHRIMGGNDALIAFLQRAIGYSLTGFCEEHDLFFLHGKGDNGKSTFLEVIRSALGDYAMATPASTLLSKRWGSIPNDVARLKGARFVTATETGKGRRLDEAMVKAMTGGDRITARFMRAEWFEYKPEFVFWLATNNKPTVKETANAIWNRIKLIPFTVTIPKAEQDQDLKNKLGQELPGIMAWAVRGCMNWQKHGMGAPTEITRAVEEYREEQDTLGAFIEKCCEIGAHLETSASGLYLAYKNWCDDSGEKAMSKKALGQELAERGFDPGHATTGSRARLWRGIGLP